MLMLNIISSIVEGGGNPLFVGGCVRDELLGIAPKDFDIEVYGLSYEELSTIVSKYGDVDFVGKSFGIVKLRSGELELDFSLPRKDSKNGVGHKGFDVESDPNMTPEEACGRRDFTINSMMKKPNGEIVDIFNGQKDLRLGFLRPTTVAFYEDPLRILRGFQFSARFKLIPSQELHAVNPIFFEEFSVLPISRIWGEWYKWATKGKYYSTSLEYLKLTGLLNEYFELSCIDGVQQDPEWHPEGDVYIHTGLVLDWAGKVCEENNITGDDRCVIIFAALCHDLGKATTTAVIDGRIRARGHEAAGVDPARSFLTSVGCPEKIIKRVLPLVANHMVCCQPLSDKAIRRLSDRVEPASIRELALLIESDQCGRSPKPQVKSQNLCDMVNRAVMLNVLDKKPEPIITGDDIVAYGIKQGVEVGKIHKIMYDLQLKGSFKYKDEGLKLLNTVVKQRKAYLSLKE